MNFEMAAEMATGPTATVLVQDDVAVESSTYSTSRRGVAGTLVVEKIVGAAAEAGADLAACAALTSCTVPAAGKPTFTLSESEMELGVGIHGEPGRRRVATRPADAVAAELVDAILHDLAPRKGEPLLLFLNGFGGTPLLELYLMFDAAARRLAAGGLTIARSLVGNFVTSLEMAGCSVTLARLDEEMLRLWDAPVHTAALRWGR